MAYNTDIFTGCDGLFICLADWSNTVTQGYFWSIMLFALSIVLFMGTFNFGANRAFGYAGFGMGIMALFLIQLDLIPLWVLTLSLVMTGLGIAAMFLSER